MKEFLALVKKELRLLGRASNGILSLIVIVSAMVFLFHYALERNGNMDMVALVGLKWSILFVASFVLVGQFTWEERESGGGTASRLFVSPWILFLSKSILVFLALSGTAFYLLGLFALFFKAFPFEWVAFEKHLVFFLPGLLCISFLGVCLSHISLSSRLKEILLPLLLVPLSIPIFLYGMEAERKFASQPFSSLVGSFGLLLAFAFFYGSMGALLVEMTSDD
ncbi:ABC transporter permease [Leptospira wolffii]|uniref:ABC transporter permease n=1 Tax=Leptospira wolffii TaxID=409998 RepID=A0A2M9Z7D6_9LEPT|nr:heme exporter protein CcmB [Leptospira wolffii]EPG66258.1 CcmB protein [Leptospira wolffii serovar Khorat str. Khorat-H2]PJZ64335.1 ABC transporter permease [Leptospira wolffii]TGK58297.1 ABC transporter permease [Leptospira wolffii]TGK66326.1 ABC transporter permease [Leptospira wolffii]TGK68975.1 ABC transporter permease [Leptospira wolffii]